MSHGSGRRRYGVWLTLAGAMSACGGNDRPPAPDGGLEIVCTEDALAAGCRAGPCQLSAPRATLSERGRVRLSARPMPAALAADALGSSLCSVELLDETTLTGDLSLSVDAGVDLQPDAALFRYRADGTPSELLRRSLLRSAQEASGQIRESGDYGITRRPPGFSVDGFAGMELSASQDAASFLRNVSSRPMRAVHFDGTHLFVGSGQRILIWTTLPSTPTTPPDVVLGQPSLDANQGGTSAAVWQGGISGLWSDGTRLVASAGNRVLVWNAIPTKSGAPADLVLGQPDFTTDAANTGGISASSMSEPYTVDSDGQRLIVADMRNNRALVWDPFPTSLGAPATGVIGQPGFATSAGPGATNVYLCWSALLDGPGAWIGTYAYGIAAHVPSLGINPASDYEAVVAYYPQVTPIHVYLNAAMAYVGNGLAIRDAWGMRVGIQKARPTSPTPFDVVLGQPDPYRSSLQPTSASTLEANNIGGMRGHGADLWLADGARVLLFEAPAYHFQPASRVFGQAGFSTNVPGIDYRGISAATLGHPAGVAVAGGTIAVADRGNNRVLLFDKGALGPQGATAKVVLGQPDFASFVPNVDQTKPSATTLSGPSSVALDGTHLVVADTENHRVLLWNTVPTKSGQPADVVLGQADFAGRRPNRGRGDVSPKDGYSDADADGFFYPTGVATDGTHLVVADRQNHRVLVWKTWPTQNGQPADAVIGQPSFTEVRPNGGAGPYAVAPDGLNLPNGVTIDGTRLWIADTENNRVVRYDAAFTAPTPTVFLGQSSGSTVANPNYAGPADYNTGTALTQPTTATSVLRPMSVAVTAAGVFVSEWGSNRVHVFDPSLAHVAVLGQSVATSAAPNGGGLGATSLFGPLGIASDGTTLLVADSRNNRILGYAASPLPATNAAATVVLGQPSTSTAGFNQGSAARGGATARARGMHASGGQLFVADSENHRVVVHTSPPQAGTPPVRIFGQPDEGANFPNAGGLPSARSMRGPRGVFADATHVFVADTGNHRVLVFDRNSPSPDATLVLGQGAFDAVNPNRGGAAGADTMRGPEGVWFDGTRLFVADTGNHRVLVWNGLPASNGAPADLILGQRSSEDVLPNRGAGPTASSLFSPSAVLSLRGALWIADTGNNRVLRYDVPPAQTGEAATAVLGQPSFSERLPAQTALDRAGLAGPVALATDGTWILVLDRDLGRVLRFTSSHASSTPAHDVYGPLQGLQAQTPGGLAAEATPLFTTRVLVADTGASRILVTGGLGRLVER
jgi:sugar lactone lactonase YvrE